MFKTRKLILITILFVASLFLGTHVFAATSGLPSIPGAPDPNSIDTIPGLISYIYNLAFWIVGIAVFFSVLRGGFIIFFGAAGSASKVSEGKKIITNAIVGLILLFSSWLILNVINPDLVKNTFDFGALLQGSGGTGGTPNPTISGGGGSTSPTPVQTVCVPDGRGGQICTTLRPSPTPLSSNPGPSTTVGAGSCVPLQPGSATRCYDPSKCDQYQADIQKYARGAVTTAAFMKSIMWIESTCNARAQSGAGAYGVMQFLVSSAQTVAQRSGVRTKCGIGASEQISSSWLLNQSNAGKQICLSVEYFNGDIARRCDPLPGDKVRNYGGGYNAGQGRCSVVSQNPSCDNAPKRKYEQYSEAEKYGRKILYCLAHQ